MSTNFDSMDAAYRYAISSILNRGQSVAPRGMPTREILGFGFSLTNPRARTISIPERKWSYSYAIGELCWHLSGSRDVKTISYYSRAWDQFSDNGKTISRSCYGNKIFCRRGKNPSQWDSVIRLLTHDAHSRRAIINLATDCGAESKTARDVSCISTIQFIVRNSLVHCITTMRSNDVILGLPYDVFFATMLQELLAVTLKLDVGLYTHFAGSLHTYDTDLEMVNAINTTNTAIPTHAMGKMSSIDNIPLFLATERALRNNTRDAPQMVDKLAPYWKRLTEPLIEKHLRMHHR